MRRDGFTLTELVFAIALGALVVAISFPAFAAILKNVRHESAVRRFVSDVREARSHAITKGWEYRVVGYGDEETEARRNQYRILARRSSAVAWPAEEVAPFTSQTQFAGRWIDVASEYPGVLMEADNAPFTLTFDARGSSPTAPANFNPLKMTGANDLEATLTVSVVGGITVY